MKSWFFVLFSLLVFVTCDNVTFSPLVGKWQLKTVEKNGEITLVDTVWYNFQSISLFSLQIYEPQEDNYLSFEGVRTQKDKVISITLFLESSCDHSDWNSTNRSFSIVNMNRQRLLLQGEEGYFYSFIKF